MADLKRWNGNAWETVIEDSTSINYRLTTAQRNLLTPSTGDRVYNLDEESLQVWDGLGWVSVGFTVHNDLTGLNTADAHPASAITGLVADLAAKLPYDGGQMSGDLALYTYREREASTSTSTMAVVFTGEQVQRTSRNGTLTVTFSNLPSDGQVRSVTMIVGSGVTTITWPAGTRFVDGAVPDAPVGECWYSVVARGSAVTVFEVGREVS